VPERLSRGVIPRLGLNAGVVVAPAASFHNRAIRARRLIPGFDGAPFSSQSKDALRYGPASSWERHATLAAPLDDRRQLARHAPPRDPNLLRFPPRRYRDCGFCSPGSRFTGLHRQGSVEEVCEVLRVETRQSGDISVQTAGAVAIATSQGRRLQDRTLEAATKQVARPLSSPAFFRMPFFKALPGRPSALRHRAPPKSSSKFVCVHLSDDLDLRGSKIKYCS
jgi:hypothetical protein